ncbi:hypothetical protein [Agromyces salentinus]|uniref:N-acetyltransferase domain-containing protein n=1 Tax=Agromyces salentinus TaxID=269421 RepID=A0ABP4Z8L4_9MICO|nr:hypothetical protein [Agromyces salentinus]
MGEPHVVTLRATRDTDLDTLHRNPHHDTSATGLVRRTVRADGEIVGELESVREGEVIVVSLDALPAELGEAVRVRALRLFVDTLPRPVHAKPAGDAASVAVLERCGFRRVDGEFHRLD